MDKEHKRMQVEGWLKLIDRTRLFCNTADELEKLVGFSVSNRNSLARKGGNSLFMKEAIFHQLGYICHELTDLDLQTIVDSYEDVDNFIERYSIRLRGETLLPQVVDYFFGSGQLSDELDFIGKRLEDKHIAILLLMLTGSLPRLSAKNGDVTHIDADYRRTFALLRDLCKDLPLQELPAIAMMEEEIRRNPKKKSRLHLIYVTDQILSAYSAISTQNRLSFTNRELLNKRVMPEISGIWTENDSFTSFWYFEEVCNGYSMYRYELKDDHRELRYTKFFISFYQQSDDTVAVIVHPKAIRAMLSGQPMPTALFSYQKFGIDNNVLTFVAEGERKEWFNVSRMIRSAHENFFKSLLDNNDKIRVNQYAADDYDFSMLLAAITNEHIYIKNGEGSYYKIPKSLNDVLYDVQFGDNVGLITFATETYVAFDDKNLYYDVSSEEQMAKSGIQIVTSITE